MLRPGSTQVASSIDLHVARKPRRSALGWKVRNWLRMAWTGEAFLPLRAWLYTRALGAQAIVADLRGRIDHADGTVTDLGVIGRHLVVTAGKNYLAATLDGTNTASLFKFHGFGTGTTAATVGDTALTTELTTQYATANTRPTGSQSHSANTYTTAGTLSPTANVAITEWGLFTQAATGGGTLLDHQVFSAVNLVGNSDSLTVTYTLTFS